MTLLQYLKVKLPLWQQSPVQIDTKTCTLIITLLDYPTTRLSLCRENMCHYVPIWQNRGGTWKWY